MSEPNEAEDAERELLIDKLMELDGLIPSTGKRNCEKNGHKKPCNCFFAREREEYGRNADFILADRQARKQKWVEQMDASFPTKHQLWVTAASIVNADSEDHEDDEIIEPVFKQLETIFAAWRAALRGESK